MKERWGNALLVTDMYLMILFDDGHLMMLFDRGVVSQYKMCLHFLHDPLLVCVQKTHES